MKHTSRSRQSPLSVTVWFTPSETLNALHIKRCPQVKRAHSRGSGSPTKRCQRRDEIHPVKMIKAPSVSLQLQAMAPFFWLFDDSGIRDFLCIDCCCKLTDKYLLAMTFVYFKRASFTLSEYTTKNFYLALYLANTMEEEEEETKYNIFPWALGKNWRRRFPGFLWQRDKLWARIDYRAAVSRTCCEEVMAIWPSHFAWQRERSEKHSGAQRHYGKETFSLPRSRTASQAPCSVCDRTSTASQLSGPSMDRRVSPEVSTQRGASHCSVEDFEVSIDCDSSLD